MREISRKGNFTVYKKWVIAKKMTNKKWVFFDNIYIVKEDCYSGAWKNKPIFGNVVFVGKASEETKAILQKKGYFPSKASELTRAKIEEEALKQQPSFSYEESDWWHSIIIDGVELDIQYLEDENKNLYVYEVIEGVRSEYELMVIPLDWGFNKKTNKFEQGDKQ